MLVVEAKLFELLNHFLLQCKMTLCVGFCFSEAKRTATQFNCKYIETSATLNVKVDELLVGILKQIKLTLKPEPTKSKESFVKGPIDILARLFHMKSKVKSKYDDVLI